MKRLCCVIATLAVLSILSIPALAQNIQDTFFNIRLGSIVSVQSIRNNVGTRGTYAQYENRGSLQLVTFVDISFGAELWMFGQFQSTSDSHFFEFTVNNVYSKKEDAELFYSKMKRRLREKYSNGIEEDKNSGHVIYFGGESDAYVNLELEYGKSNSGDWFYYVILTYWSGYWTNRVLQDIDSEL